MQNHTFYSALIDSHVSTFLPRLTIIITSLHAFRRDRFSEIAKSLICVLSTVSNIVYYFWCYLLHVYYFTNLNRKFTRVHTYVYRFVQTRFYSFIQIQSHEFYSKRKISDEVYFRSTYLSELEIKICFAYCIL